VIYAMATDVVTIVWQLIALPADLSTDWGDFDHVVLW